MANMNWGSTAPARVLYFGDLEVNESYQIDTNSSKGAVYRKVFDKDNGRYYAMEEATGKLFRPTKSPVKKVDVNVHLATNKPRISGY